MNISGLKTWKENMLCDCILHDETAKCMRRRVVENFEIEENIKTHIEFDFQAALLDASSASDHKDVFDSVSAAQVLSKNLMLNGPSVGDVRSEHRFVMSSKKVYKILGKSPVGHIGSLFDESGKPLSPAEKAVFLIENEFVSVDDFDGLIGNHLGFFWATFEEEFESYISMGSSPDRIRDALGLDFPTVYGEGDTVIWFKIRTSGLEEPKVPTIVEGADLPPFRPSPKGSLSGYTTDLKTGKRGFPEVVHKSVEQLNRHLVDFDVLGKLADDPSQNYLEVHK